jgi:hypothetical protein
MNQKAVKKLRQIERRGIKKVKRDIEQKTMEEFFIRTIKPKPRFIPQWIWLRGIRIFLNV